jgi:beta-galactosidase
MQRRFGFYSILSIGLICAFFIIAQADAQVSPTVRERQNFDADWRFHLGDPDDVKNNQIDYPQLKDFILASANDFTKGTPTVRPQGNPGGDVSFVKPDYDDSMWRTLNLPHDWAIEGPFDIRQEGATGKLPYAGKGWYRKHFTVPLGEDRRLFLDIDGAMAYSTVWINGQLVGGWPYGYSSYELEITPYIKPGEDNVVSIRLNNLSDSSRWYPGSGIYRHVWLVKTSPVHIAHWGTTITTPDATKDDAAINLKGTLLNESSSGATAQIVTKIYNSTAQGQPTGAAVAMLSPAVIKIASNGRQDFESKTSLPSPKLWTLQDPHRYVALTQVTQNGKLIDSYSTLFGIRTIKFDPNQGFFLNGERVPIQGVCDHQDLGALGIAFNERAAERQLEILKEMGCNALRTSHNMPAPELLDLCDRMGILVMDESFDCWKQGKRGSDYHLLFPDWHERDLRAEYRRDRNHPSVIMWSIGNEVQELSGPSRQPIASELTAIAHDEDPTRLTVLGSNVTDAWHDNATSGAKSVADGVDIYGQNYWPGVYSQFHAARPNQPVIGSETCSTVSSRGIYVFPISNDRGAGRQDFQMSSYDLYMPGWGNTPDDEFSELEKNPCAAGEFVWTGFDYLGEPTPYNGDLTNLLNFHNPVDIAKATEELKALGRIPCPSRSSYFGIVDLCGFKKDRFYLYQLHWRPDFPMVHILPHWNWPGREGQITPVYVYTSGDEAELFLNGTSLGRKKKAPFQYRLIWNDVTYAPGELKAVAYKNGQPWSETSVKTTGAATALRLEPDRAKIKGDGLDLSYVTTRLVDKDGLTVPVAQNLVKYEVTQGPGEIVATDNGDATDLNIFSKPERNAFNGLALAIVRAKPGAKGDIHLRATSDGLIGSEIIIHAE